MRLSGSAIENVSWMRNADSRSVETTMTRRTTNPRSIDGNEPVEVPRVELTYAFYAERLFERVEEGYGGMRARPRIRAGGRRIPPNRSVDLADEVEHRHVHRDNDGADDRAEQRDHDRLHQLHQARHRVVDLFLVELGNFVEHSVQRARLLANADHLHDHRWEDLRFGERLGDRAAR